MNITIVGGNGFIGQRLTEALVSYGNITVIDIAEPVKNLEKVNYIKGDISDFSFLIESLKKQDVVFHLAAFPLNPSEKNSRSSIQINVLGTLNILEAMAKNSVKHLIFSSTSSVYGNTEKLVSEDDSLNPCTIYGSCKVLAEYLIKSTAPTKNISYVILRYMNVFGEEQTDGLIPLVLQRIVNGKPPLIQGTGESAFDFVAVEDVVEANIAAMKFVLKGFNGIYNIGSGKEYSVKEIIEMMLEIMKSDLKPEFVNPDAPTIRRAGNIAAAQLDLGFKPLIDFPKKLEEIIKNKIGG